MTLTLFKNQKALIHGTDPKRLCAPCSGVLTVGKTEIPLTADEEALMPMLYQGCTGEYEACFTAENGARYALGKIGIRGGWLIPPEPYTVELMELRCRAEEAENRLTALESMFDTNALHFII